MSDNKYHKKDGNVWCKNTTKGDHVVVNFFLSDCYIDFWFDKLNMEGVYFRGKYELEFFKCMSKESSDIRIVK